MLIYLMTVHIITIQIDCFTYDYDEVVNKKINKFQSLYEVISRMLKKVGNSQI